MDDLVVMMETVVSLEVHLVVNAYHHLESHHLAVVVIEMVCEKDHHHHHQELSRDAACEDHLWFRLSPKLPGRSIADDGNQTG